MNLEEVLKTRRFVRSFSGSRIDQRIISEAIAYGQKAPSTGELKAYKFVAVSVKDKIRKIAKIARQNWIKDAGLIVIICIEPERLAKRYGERGRELYSIQDATLFGAYLDLYFVNHGLGTCWIRSFNEKKVKELLGLDLKPISLLVVGHKKKEKNNKP
jgi:nitroreductase